MEVARNMAWLTATQSIQTVNNRKIGEARHTHLAKSTYKIALEREAAMSKSSCNGGEYQPQPRQTDK